MISLWLRWLGSVLKDVLPLWLGLRQASRLTDLARVLTQRLRLIELKLLARTYHILRSLSRTKDIVLESSNLLVHAFDFFY